MPKQSFDSIQHMFNIIFNYFADMDNPEGIEKNLSLVREMHNNFSELIEIMERKIPSSLEEKLEISTFDELGRSSSAFNLKTISSEKKKNIT